MLLYLPIFSAVLIEIGRLDEAIDQLNKLVAKKSTHTMAYNNLGYAYQRKCDIFMAEKYYNIALQLDNDNTYAYCNRGLLKIKFSKDFDSGIRDLIHASDLGDLEAAVWVRNYYKYNLN